MSTYNRKIAKKFTNSLRKAIEKQKQGKIDAIIEASDEIFDDIDNDTPRETGYLASRNKLEKLKDKITFSNDTHYADDVEFGTVSFFRINLTVENIKGKLKKFLR